MMNIELEKTINNFLRSLLSAAASASLYSVEHPQVEKLINLAYQDLQKALLETDSINIMLLDKELIINNEAQESTLFISRLASIFAKAEIENLKIMAGVDSNQLKSLINFISQSKEYSQFPTLSHIKFGVVSIKHSSEAQDDADNELRAHSFSIKKLPESESDRFMELYNAAKKRKRLKIKGISEIVSNFVAAFQNQGDALLTMAALKTSSEYTFTHSTNVSILTIAQALFIGIKGDMLRDFGIAAMLHDIGKLYIPEEIITKKGGLDDKEFEIMKQHPALGAKHLLLTPAIPRIAVAVAFEHHLKYDGSGYPQAETKIVPNICSQMTMIADFFDALRTRRSYREPVEFNKIADMMLSMRGKELHPALTNNFLSIMSKILADKKGDK